MSGSIALVRVLHACVIVADTTILEPFPCTFAVVNIRVIRVSVLHAGTLAVGNDVTCMWLDDRWRVVVFSILPVECSFL